MFLTLVNHLNLSKDMYSEIVTRKFKMAPKMAPKMAAGSKKASGSIKTVKSHINLNGGPQIQDGRQNDHRPSQGGEH